MITSEQQQHASAAAHVPSPPSETRSWLLAGAIGLLGVAVLIAALTGALDSGAAAARLPPPVVLIAPTPVAGAQSATSALDALKRPAGALGAASVAGAGGTARAGAQAGSVRVSERWMEGFYPIYGIAEHTFGVNWLLIASIHMQETAFSTAPSTYHGLNFLHCCGGPMQFNVTNGPVTTWELVADSYIYARRPAHYDHRTAKHPSIYDDFDSIMAAAHLLSADGATYALDGSAWAAAYGYYGHGREGVEYADEVLARAIGWSQHGFCIECAVRAPLVQAVYAAYGAPVLQAIESEERAQARAKKLAALQRARAQKPSAKPAG